MHRIIKVLITLAAVALIGLVDALLPIGEKFFEILQFIVTLVGLLLSGDDD